MEQEELLALEETVNNTMMEIPHPVRRRTLGDLGIYANLEWDGEQFRLFVKVPDSDRKVQIDLEAKIRGQIKEILSGPVKIKFEVDETLQSEAGDERGAGMEGGAEGGRENKHIPGVKHIIAVGSGKGGVGKSTVSSNLAATLLKMGYKVGLLDADIYGPSLGGMFGREGKQTIRGNGQNRIFPEEIHGLKLISFSFLLDEEQPVIWRGPMLAKALEQLLFDVEWGELDFLVIDMPPGTGDIQLSLPQFVEVDGAVIVTTPQKVSLYDATRALNMFKQMNVPVLGVVENMSEFVCPSCKTVTHIFSKKGGENFAEKYAVPHLGGLPLMKEIMESAEKGMPYVLEEESGPIAEAYKSVAEKLLNGLKKD